MSTVVIKTPEDVLAELAELKLAIDGKRVPDAIDEKGEAGEGAEAPPQSVPIPEDCRTAVQCIVEGLLVLLTNANAAWAVQAKQHAQNLKESLENSSAGTQ